MEKDNGGALILISIIIPIKNEKENLEILIPRIIKELTIFNTENQEKFKFEIIIIDDFSFDNPETIIEMYKKSNNLVEKKDDRVIVRLKRINNFYKKSVGRALRKGIEISNGEIIVTMDGDLSHDPSILPICITHVNEGKDFIIGSRFLPKQYFFRPLSRYIVSKFFNILVKTIYRVKIYDFTTGFRCFRKKLLENFDLRENGYALHFELNKKLIRNTKIERIIEIPIEYKKRVKGKSKFSYTRTFFDYLKNI